MTCVVIGCPSQISERRRTAQLRQARTARCSLWCGRRIAGWITFGSSKVSMDFVGLLLLLGCPA